MRLTKNRLGILLAHGLHESEARVYLTLLDHPSMTAGTLSKMADVPRSHLYKVLQDLQNRGLVEILLQGSARTYRAKPLRSFLERRAQELKLRLGELQQEMATLAEAFEPPPLGQVSEADAGDVRIVIGRRAVARQIDDMLAAATHHVVLAGSDSGYERLVRHILPHLDASEAHHDAGPTFELVLPSKARTHSLVLRALTNPRVTARWLRISRSIMSVAQDDVGILFVNPVPDTPDVRTGRDFAIFSGDKAFIENHIELLRAASDETPPVPHAPRDLPGRLREPAVTSAQDRLPN